MAARSSNRSRAPHPTGAAEAAAEAQDAVRDGGLPIDAGATTLDAGALDGDAGLPDASEGASVAPWRALIAVDVSSRRCPSCASPVVAMPSPMETPRAARGRAAGGDPRRRGHHNRSRRGRS